MNCSEASGNQPSVVQEEMTETTELKEEKLKSKYPIDLGSSSGNTAFLQKRFQKGQKFFDSGDYQMAKQKCDDTKQTFANDITTGQLIPTPETVPISVTLLCHVEGNEHTRNVYLLRNRAAFRPESIRELSLTHFSDKYLEFRMDRDLTKHPFYATIGKWCIKVCVAIKITVLGRSLDTAAKIKNFQNSELANHNCMGLKKNPNQFTLTFIIRYLCNDDVDVMLNNGHKCSYNTQCLPPAVLQFESMTKQKIELFGNCRWSCGPVLLDD
ncbi:hypothetical protein GQX74_005019 [Glossina fuscipes]|nr:hypothetical protein GQX74_005019 [Glossina fuscipes]